MMQIPSSLTPFDFRFLRLRKPICACLPKTGVQLWACSIARQWRAIKKMHIVHMTEPIKIHQNRNVRHMGSFHYELFIFSNFCVFIKWVYEIAVICITDSMNGENDLLQQTRWWFQNIWMVNYMETKRNSVDEASLVNTFYLYLSSRRYAVLLLYVKHVHLVLQWINA